MTSVKELQRYGQSVYLDEIRRTWLSDGTLASLIENDGLRGVTSNPAIFEKAIAQSDDYDSAIAALARKGMDAKQVYEELTVDDIRAAADLFRPTYDASAGRYGYVSLEVSPLLADDTEATVLEARHLWKRLDRPNVFIKVPGTEAGTPAIRQLIAEGINVNVTLLFGLQAYRDVAEAFQAGLEERLSKGQEIADVASVASFFLSRIDVMVDPMLDEVAARGGSEAATAAALRGKVAIASAKRAYAIYLDLIAQARWKDLSSKGARPQRLLWASTSTKDPTYPDTMYVEPLIGPDTINTLPLDTIDAYRDHGNPANRITEGMDEAATQLRQLAEVGIDLDDVTASLVRQGVEKFIKPFDSLLATLDDALTKAPA